MKQSLLLGGSLLLGFGWFLFGVQIYSAVDTVFHLYFAREFFEALLESLSWPDWDAFPYDGRGTPAFRFYAPLGYLISSIWQLLGAPVHVALKGTILFYALIGAWGVYLWFRRIGLSRERWTGACLFLTSPFLAVHITRVFFFQNILGVLLLPWVLFGLAHRGKGRRRGGIIAGVALGAIALTHLPAAMMCGYISVMVLALTRHVRESRRSVAAELLLIMWLSFGLSAPYMLPAMAERHIVNFQSHMQIQEIGKPGDFLDDCRVDSSGSANDSGIFARHLHARFRFLLVLMVCGSISLWVCPAPSLIRRFWLVGFFIIPLLLRVTLPLWKVVPGLSVLQYSWRWVFPASILLLPGIARDAFTYAFWRWSRHTIFALWILILLHVHWVAQPLTEQEWDVVARLGFHYPCEYVPATCTLANCTLPHPLSTIGGAYHRFWGNASMSFQIHDSRRDHAKVEVQLSTDTIVTSQTHYDPFWEVYDLTNQQSVSIHPFGNCGLLQFQLPATCREFRLSRISSPFRILGWVIFGATLLLLVSMIFHTIAKARETAISPQMRFQS